MSSDLKVAEDFIAKHPYSAAKVLEGLSETEIAQLIQQLPIDLSLALLNAMDRKMVANCFKLLPKELTKDLLENCDPYFVTSLFKKLDKEFLRDLIPSLQAGTAELIKQKLLQAKNSVGSLMIPISVIHQDISVKEAIDLVKKSEKQNSSFLYVVDSEGQFSGVVEIYQLLRSEENATVKQLLIREVPKFFAETPLKNLEKHAAWHDFRNIPVIDQHGKLIGILPYKTLKKETQKSEEYDKNGVAETSKSLAELYFIGLTGLLQSVGKR